MALGTIASIAKMAVEVGPTFIRGISSLFGGSDTATKIADAVDELGTINANNKNVKERELADMLSRLPKADFVEMEKIKIQLEKEITRRQELAYTDIQKEHEQSQLTIRQGDEADDQYVRHTRPKLARQSWYISGLYVLGLSALQAYGKGNGPNIEMTALLLSPAWAYLGLRTMDGFSKYAKSSKFKLLEK